MHLPNDSASGTWRQLLRGPYLGTATVLAGGVALYATNVYLTTSLLPTAIEEIGGQRYYAWTTTVFLVASVISSMLVTNILTARGPRGAYLIGLAVFAVGTAACSVSPTMELFLIGRMIQGLGGGLLAGLGYAVINAALPKHLWTRGAALVSAMWGVGTFAGPAIGGVFAQLSIWRWAFGVLIIATIAVAALVPSALPPQTVGVATKTPVPALSLALLTAAAAMVSIAGILSNLMVTAAMVGAAVMILVAFVAADRRAAHGILPPSTFSGSSLKWVYLTIVVLAVASTAEMFIPLFGQRLAGLSPIAAGFLGAALALGWTLGEVPSASATARGVVRRIVVCGPILVAVGLGIMAAFVTDHAGFGVLIAWTIGLLVAGVGIGIAWPHLAVAAMTSVAEPGEGPRASAAINTVQLIANAFGAALAGVLVNIGEPSALRSAQLLLFTFAAIAIIGAAVAGRALPRRRTTVDNPDVALEAIANEPRPDRPTPA
ncbi:MFS transporter [Gordonia rubripertincta]|uniref:MFS transporter n=1 Tax=Gordonia rubripertincta TaxID=36822 RepID=A0ABT4MVD5_GORRU|nr:MFS transporter [Gordonia rubripertincta]MCZ4550962.1 MFS transporter [Gordonia rubripertincta]